MPRSTSQSRRRVVRGGGDHLQIGAGRGVGFGAALFPVTQRAKRDAAAHGKFLLGEAERPADDLDLRHSGRGVQLLFR